MFRSFFEQARIEVAEEIVNILHRDTEVISIHCGILGIIVLQR
ncbi:MAG TPA: hypothetical protein VGW39_06055 [Chthoniobacterales bacterium]|nr:hypothetical protein [Chthoniobacterales bacterium]